MPLLNEDNQKLFEKYGVLNQAELVSRYHVFKEDYERRLDIEGRVALEIAKSIIRPVVFKEYLAISNGGKSSQAIETVRLEMEKQMEAMNAYISTLEEALDSGEGIRHAIECLRKNVDALEQLIDDSIWPLPKYREMLFIY